jgi:hypothetical protein
MPDNTSNLIFVSHRAANGQGTELWVRHAWAGRATNASHARMRPGNAIAGQALSRTRSKAVIQAIARNQREEVQHCAVLPFEQSCTSPACFNVCERLPGHSPLFGEAVHRYHATAWSPFLATRESSFREAPWGRFSPRSHWLTSPVVTLR